MRHFQLSLIALLVLILAVIPLAGCTSASEDEAWKDKYEILQIENITLNVKLESALTDLADLGDTAKGVMDDYDNLKTENNKLEADYLAANTNRKRLQTELDTLKANQLTVEKPFNQLQVDYDALKAGYDSLEGDIILCDNALAAQTADYNSLKADYDTLQALYTDVSNKLAEAETPSLPVSTPTIIESYIDGTFEGWKGDTLFKLTNGQIWEQASYSYTYHYAYRPEVLIYSTAGGYKMRVEGVSKTIYVRQLK